MTKRSRLLLLACVLFTGFSLRPPIISITPLIEIIRSDLNLPASVAGLITTIPLVAFACLSPMGGALAVRFGLGKILRFALAMITVGIFVRSWLGVPGLMLGTLMVGIGIAFGNVLLPAVVKSRFPDRVGPMTSMYATAMNGLAGVASAMSVPLAVRVGLGWRTALLLWSVPAMVGVVLWHRNRELRLEESSAKRDKPIWRNKTAWWVSFYMGFQSLFYFSFMAWAPSVLQAKGFDAETAGYMVTVYQLIGIPGNLLMPIFAAKRPNQRGLALIIGLAYTLGLAAFWAAEGAGILLVTLVVMGVGTGACFSYCMTLMSLRAGSPATAAKLSGMSQAVGYIIAAVGPVLEGRLVDITGSWNASLFCMLLAGIGITLLGQKVCKPVIIE